MYLPLHNVSRRNYFLKIPFTELGLLTGSLPMFAFIICVLVTVYKDFENANYTHCEVPNIIPSISASIGKYEPQQTIWRIAVYIHAPSRFYMVYLRGQYYKNVIKHDCFIVAKIAVCLNFMENMALLGVTYWTSSLYDYYTYHETCFKIFVGTSLLYMLFTCVMLTKYRRRPNITNFEQLSIKYKWGAFCINVGSFVFAAYFFWRHNKLCEPYVYSMFGFSEYIVIFSNIAFHFTTYYDLRFEYIYVTSKGLVVE